MTDVQTEAAIDQPIEYRLAPLRERIKALERDAQPQSPTAALRMLADLFSESAHETWTKEEIVNIIEDAIRLGSPDTRPLRPDGADDLEHLDGMLDDRERG